MPFLCLGGAALALLGAVLVLAVIAVQFLKYVDYFVCGYICNPMHPFQRLGWGWIGLMLLGLLLVSYFFAGKVIAFSYQTSFKNLFGKSAIILWCVTLASYVCCLALALHATSDYRRCVDDLAAYFGHPMTASGYGDLYYAGRQPDGAFWKQVEELLKKAEAAEVVVSVKGEEVHQNAGELLGFFEAVMDDDIYGPWKDYFLNNESIRQLEAMLDTSLPAAELDFSNDKLLSMNRLAEMGIARWLARLELWQMRLAMEADDDDAVQLAWRRLGNVCAYLQNEPFCIGAILWISVERWQLKALTWLVPWEKAETAWLETQAVRLAEKEAAVVQVHRRAIYGEAVFAANAVSVYLAGGADMDLAKRPMTRFTALRWFFPQVWRLLAHDETEAMRAYKITDFADFPKEGGDNLLLDMRTSPASVNAKFPTFIAELRILRGIINAELEKRRTGRYPERLDTLQDPFANHPLQYRVGICEIQTTKVALQKEAAYFDEEDETDENDEDETLTTYAFTGKQIHATAAAVQIWSVGPDGVDDGGFSGYRNEKAADDIRHVILLK